MANKNKKYEVTIISTEGTGKSPIFEKMCKKGDVVAEKISECVGDIITPTGYACCKIVTDEKEFEMNYYITEEGIFSSGSEIFYESFTDYFGDVEKMKICEVKTKKGKTYKVSPVLTFPFNEE